MNATSLRALVALVPASMLLCGSVLLFRRGHSVWLLAQMIGAGCLTVVVLTHIAEGLHVLPSMQWGLEHSKGHYLDLVSALLAFTLFPLGYLLYALAGERRQPNG
jgi:hypothetical protein